jgi:serine/threonine protein phosphatase PrpC/CRP-like cAMP-binding protein
MQIETFGASDVGQTRSANEDAFVLAPDLGLVAVADGMGGFQRGDVASQVAVNVLVEAISAGSSLLAAYRAEPSDRSRGAVKAVLEAAVQRACEEVYAAGVAITGQGGRMGTTLDALLVVGGTAFIAHVGDGRIYLLRGSEVHQLTEDHSLVQQQLKEGLITEEQARTARNKNVITRALGVLPSVQVDSLHFELDLGDKLLLCSDGLHRYVGMRELGLAMLKVGGEAAVRQLVDSANGRGGRDNITCVVVELGAADAQRRAPEGPQADHIAVLRRVDLFAVCTYRELLAASQIAAPRAVPAGTLLFAEGEVGRECFIVVQGLVELRKGQTVLARASSGDYFGELSFVDSPKRSADAVAIEDTTFLVIERDRFLQLMKQDAELAVKLTWQLLRHVAAQLRATSEKLVAEPVLTDTLSVDVLKDA